jgi:hypothetical protein
MKKEIPDIVINYPNYLPEIVQDELRENFSQDKLKLELNAEEPQMWAAMEWIIPGLLTSYILKPYFESFLAEMGKDHYVYLKKSLKSFVSKYRSAPITTHVSKGADKKISKENTQSKAISVYLQLKNGQMLKLLFDTEIEMEKTLAFLDDILDKVLNHYEEFPNDNFSKEIIKLDEKPYNNICAIINEDTGSWELYNMEKIIHKALKNKQKSSL